MNTKKRLIASLLAMAMCFTMLVGSTFAWFTDTASTAVNKIEAGTLKIDLVDKDGNSLEDETLNFADKDENKLWEPGVTYKLEEIKVVNKGNLALKFKVVITGVNGTAIDGRQPTADLAKVIDVIIGGKNVGTLREVMNDTDGAAYGTLSAGEEATLGEISLHMQETAGNEYQGQTLDSIAVTVYATQTPEEYDSFNNTYDENALYLIAVNNADELTSAIENVQNGDTIALMDDVKIEQLTIDEDKEINIDLNGNELIIGDAVENKSDGMVIENGATVNITNSATGKSIVEYVGTNTNYDAFMVKYGATLNFNNIDVIVSPEANSAIHAEGKDTVVNIGEGTNIITKGETDNQYTALYIAHGATVNMTDGSITIESNLNKTDDSWNDDAVGVMLLGDNCEFNMTGGTITVRSKNSMAQGVQISTYNGAGDSVINLNGGIFDVKNEGTKGSSCAFAIFDPKEGTVNVDGATFTGVYDDMISTYYPGTPNITITSGTFAFNPDGYVAADSAVAENAGVYTVTK